MTRLKICGIRSPGEGRLAERSGAAAIGLLVGQRHLSDDFLDIAAARGIARAVGPYVGCVLVTHLEEPARIVALAEQIPCTAVQAHAPLPSSVLRKLRAALRPRRLIGLVSVEDHRAPTRAASLAPVVDAIVLDSLDRATGRVGGTGRTHDWSVSARIVRESRIPVILAGGLTPRNVGRAVALVRPWAVDVNSGVEGADGAKSERRIRDFVRALRAADSRAGQA